MKKLNMFHLLFYDLNQQNPMASFCLVRSTNMMLERVVLLTYKGIKTFMYDSYNSAIQRTSRKRYSILAFHFLLHISHDNRDVYF